MKNLCCIVFDTPVFVYFVPLHVIDSSKLFNFTLNYFVWGHLFRSTLRISWWVADLGNISYTFKKSISDYFIIRI